MFLSFRKKDKEEIKRLSDESLIAAFIKTGKDKYFSEIFSRYTHLVFGVCLKYLRNEEDAKDAVMQIFENLIVSLNDRKIKNFKSWIYMVAKNHCLMKLRKEKTVSNKKEDYKKSVLAEIMELPVEEHHIIRGNNEDVIGKLEKAIKNLKTEQRICIEILYLQNKSYAEVSEMTGYTVKQVKSYVQNGKRNLKNYLEKR